MAGKNSLIWQGENSIYGLFLVVVSEDLFTLVQFSFS